MSESREPPYPDAALRGIHKSKWVRSGGLISGDAFRPDSRTADQREDGGKEVSINWEDDEGALRCLRASGTAAANGVARILRAKLDMTQREHPKLHHFYERAPLAGNSYHGNIVFGADAPIDGINHIANVLGYFSHLVDPETA